MTNSAPNTTLGRYPTPPYAFFEKPSQISRKPVYQRVLTRPDPLRRATGYPAALTDRANRMSSTMCAGSPACPPAVS